MYLSCFQKSLTFSMQSNQATKKMTAKLNWQLDIYRDFSMYTRSAIKRFGAWGLKVTPAIPEKHIINVLS